MNGTVRILQERLDDLQAKLERLEAQLAEAQKDARRERDDKNLALRAIDLLRHSTGGMEDYKLLWHMRSIAKLAESGLDWTDALPEHLQKMWGEKRDAD